MGTMRIAAASIIDLYIRHADTWVRARQQEAGFYERGWFEKFCSLLPSGSMVLDLGCGPGMPLAAYLVARGYSVTGVDSSPVMASLFQKALPAQQILVADMRQLALGRLFAGLLAWDSFFHLTHDDQRRMFGVFRAHAAPRAALMFTSGPAHGEAMGELGGEPLYHASLGPDEYRALLKQHGFDVIATVAQDQTCRGRTVWLAQLA